MVTYSKKKYATKAELTTQMIMVTVSQATLAKLDAIESNASGKLADVRGSKVEQLFSLSGADEDAKKEVQRLQIQLASTSKRMTELAEQADILAAKSSGTEGAIEELQSKLATAKDLAESRNKIIRALMTIVNEVGF